MKNKNNFQTAIQELLGNKPDSNPTELPKQSENPVLSPVKTESIEKEEENPMKLEPSPSPTLTQPVFESIIAPDMVIEGSITTGSNIKLYGKVKGNVSGKGDILLSKGVVVGEVKGANLTLNNAQIEGNVTSNNALYLDNTSVVIGNLNAATAELDGKIKGNIYTQETIKFKENTVILGDVKAASISVENGATIKGNFDISSENITDEYFELYSFEI